MMDPSRGAVLTVDERHRLKLWRTWDRDKPVVLFVMLNPSTADAEKDDNTIRKCTAMVQGWGEFGGFYVGNLFSQRTSKPAVLNGLDLHDRSALRLNDKALLEMRARCTLTVVAWGNNGLAHAWRTAEVMGILKGAHALRLTRAGAPWHPSFMRAFPALRELVPY